MLKYTSTTNGAFGIHFERFRNLETAGEVFRQNPPFALRQSFGALKGAVAACLLCSGTLGSARYFCYFRSLEMVERMFRQKAPFLRGRCPSVGRAERAVFWFSGMGKKIRALG